MNVCLWSIKWKDLKCKNFFQTHTSHFEFYHHKFLLELPGIEPKITSCHDDDNPPGRWRRFVLWFLDIMLDDRLIVCRQTWLIQADISSDLVYGLQNTRTGINTSTNNELNKLKYFEKHWSPAILKSINLLQFRKVLISCIFRDSSRWKKSKPSILTEVN